MNWEIKVHWQKSSLTPRERHFTKHEDDTETMTGKPWVFILLANTFVGF